MQEENGTATSDSRSMKYDLQRTDTANFTKLVFGSRNVDVDSSFEWIASSTRIHVQI